MSKRIRELATALLDGSARAGDRVELCNLIHYAQARLDQELKRRGVL